MLRVCDGHGRHQEVAYSGNTCPLCLSESEKAAAIRDKDELQGELDKVRATLEKVLQ